MMVNQRLIRFSRIISLSHPITPAMPRWPGDPEVEFATVATREREGYFLRRFRLGEHSGTHVNAPLSFCPDGAAMDEMPPETWVVPAIVIDISRQCAADPDYCLSRSDVEHWEARNGPVSGGSCVLLQSGWSSRWHDGKAYLNLDDEGLPHYPGFSVEAAFYLLEARKAAGLGTDTPGVDAGVDNRFSINRLVLERQRIVLENLNGLDRLPAVGTTLIIGVLALEGGSGSPAAVTAVMP
ncbi:MAG: cyclase family protein [Methylococcaceae bacterium]|nr:cyclase family protein [Methylococcaceae bacterium]